MCDSETTVRRRCVCENGLFYIIFFVNIIVPLIIISVFLVVAVTELFRNRDKRVVKLIFVIIGILFLKICYSLTFHYYYCTNQFIPGQVYGCRQKIRKHDFSLEKTLNRLANYIPGIEKLVNIEELAWRNLEQLSWGLRSTISSAFWTFSYWKHSRKVQFTSFADMNKMIWCGLFTCINFRLWLRYVSWKYFC